MVTLTSSEIDELVQPDRVHRRVYTDPEIFDLEMQRIFGRSWIYVAHESEIPNPGDYKTWVIGRQPIIITRHDDGQVYGLYNRCMHRGSLVCRDQTGTSNHFRCPYHGWTYRNDGTLLGVPFRTGYARDFDLDGLGLMRVPRLDSYRGFIFVSLSPDGPELDEFLGGMKMCIDYVVDRAPDGEIEVRSGVHKYEYRGNWKFQIENVVDRYHPMFSHESTLDRQGFQFRRRADTDKGDQFITRDTDATNFYDAVPVHAFPYGHSILLGADTNPRTGPVMEQYIAALESYWGAERVQEMLRTSMVNSAFYPNMNIQEDRHIRVIRPVAVDRTEVWVYPIRLKGAPDELNESVVRYINVTHSAASFIQTDDTEVFRRCQEGLQAEGPEWVILARGIEREFDGQHPGERVALGTDELAFRNQFRYWKELMRAD